MDNLTHSLVGAAISKAGGERTTPLATATLVVAANAPDIDVLAFVRGEYFALSFRRGITHGWLALLVLPFVVAGIMLGWDRWVRRRRDPGAAPARARPILALSALGLLTHPTLDWMNTYGMRWGLPFDGSWSYGDALFIIDPWIWLVLGGAVFLSARPGRRGLSGWVAVALVTSALVAFAGGPWIAVIWGVGLGTIVLLRMRHGPTHPLGPRAVRGAIGSVVVYVALLVAGDRVARDQVRDAAVAAGLTVEDVMVAPLPANPLRSAIEVRTDEALVPGIHSWVGRPRVELDLDFAEPLLDEPLDVPPARVRAIVESARSEATVRDYLVWSRYPYVRIAPEGDGWRVRFSDARYDSRPEAGGLAGVDVWVPDPEIR